MRHAVAHLALFLALGGTGLAAGRLITSADINDGSVTGADIRERTLRVRDFSAGALRGRQGPRGAKGATGPPGPFGAVGPPGYMFDSADATVSAGGAIIEGELGGVSVRHPAPGVYCFEALYGNIFQVSSADAGAPKIVAADPKPTSAPACPGPTTVWVSVFAPSGEPTDGAFHIVVS
jgi:hypothetical protein